MTGHSLNSSKCTAFLRSAQLIRQTWGILMIRATIQWYTPIHVQSSRLSLWFSGDVDIRWRSFQKRFRESIVFKYITRIQEIFTWTEKTRFSRILVIGFTKLPKEFSVFPRVHGRFPQKRNYANHKMPTNDEKFYVAACIF